MEIEDKFREAMLSHNGAVVIMMGSDSDDKGKDGKPSHIEKIVKSLETFEIPYDVRVGSAHKQPEFVKEIIIAYNEIGGSYTIVDVAGGTDALSGVGSWFAEGLVVSCPPDAPNYSPLNNPPGSSNVYCEKPENIGRAVAQQYCGANLRLRKLLKESCAKKEDSLVVADGEIRRKYVERQRESRSGE